MCVGREGVGSKTVSAFLASRRSITQKIQSAVAAKLPHENELRAKCGWFVRTKDLDDGRMRCLPRSSGCASCWWGMAHALIWWELCFIYVLVYDQCTPVDSRSICLETRDYRETSRAVDTTDLHRSSVHSGSSFMALWRHVDGLVRRKSCRDLTLFDRSLLEAR